MINFSVVHNSLFILLSIIFILSTINPLKHRYEPIIDIEPQIIKIKDGKYVKIDYIIYSQIIDSKLYRKKKNEINEDEIIIYIRTYYSKYAIQNNC